MSARRKMFTQQDWLAFLGLTVLLIVSQLVGQEAAAGVEIGLDRIGLWSVTWAAVIGALLLGIVVLAAASLARSNPRLRYGQQVAACVLAFLAVLLSSAVPAWGFRAAGLSDASHATRISFFAGLVCIWISLWLGMLPRVQQWFQAPVDLAADRRQRPPAGPVTLIALVSRIEPKELTLGARGMPAVLVRQKGDKSVPYSLTFSSLTADIENLQQSSWPWQQLLRAVSRYAPRPGLHVVLVGSKPSTGDNRGSHEQLEMLCKPLLERYPELQNATVTVLPHALDFEDFNDVRDTIRQTIWQARRNAEETNVFVDITGGQKVASAAAAAATIGTSGRFQYVRTNDPCDVLVSDLHPQNIPAAGN